MNHDPHSDQKKIREILSRGRFRTLLHSLNPLSSSELERAAEDIRASEAAEVEAGRPRDDFMMFTPPEAGRRRSEKLLVRWVLPLMLAVLVALPFVLGSDSKVLVAAVGLALFILTAVAIILGALILVRVPADLRRALPRKGARRFLDALTRQADGDLESAIKILRRAIEQKPNTLAGRVALAGAYSQAGRYDAALAVAREAANMFPRHPWPRQLLGEIYKSQGKADDAITELEKAVNLADAIDGLDQYKGQAQKSIEEIKKLTRP